MAVLRTDTDFRFMEQSPATFHVAHAVRAFHSGNRRGEAWVFHAAWSFMVINVRAVHAPVPH